MALENVNTLLFDLDGTLVDSVPDLALSINYAMAELGLPTRDESAVRNWVGNGLDQLVHRAITQSMTGEAESDLHQQAKAHFLRRYGDHFADQSKLYPGVSSTLQQLHARGYQLACVSNKPEQFIPPILDHFVIARWFDSIIGGDSTHHKKPHPLPLITAIKALESTPEHSLMVGDSLSDFNAATRAQLPVVMVSWGYSQGADLRELSAAAVINQIDELLTLLPQSPK